MTGKKIEELVARKVKEKKSGMSRLRDRASNPFAPEILTYTVALHTHTHILTTIEVRVTWSSIFKGMRLPF